MYFIKFDYFQNLVPDGLNFIDLFYFFDIIVVKLSVNILFLKLKLNVEVAIIYEYKYFDNKKLYVISKKWLFLMTIFY